MYRFVSFVVPALAAVLLLVPIATQALTPAAAAQTANCSASTAGEAQVNESAFVASTNALSSSTDSPQHAISNAVEGTGTSGANSTRFSTDEDQAAGLYFEVNLGSPQIFNEVDMNSTFWPGDYARGYEVEVSTDGSSWTSVASCTGTASPEVVSFGTVTDQYLEAVLTTGVSANWWSIGQFFVYGATSTTTTAATTTTMAPSTTTTAAATTTTTATTNTAATTTNTAATTTTPTTPGANCTASTSGEAPLGEQGFTASTNAPSDSPDGPQNAITNAVEGTGTSGANSTRFSTDEDQSAGLHFDVNMGSARTFNELDMDSTFWPSDYARGYEVDVSSNGSSWTAVASCAGTASPEVVSFGPVTDQYLEVVLTTGVSTNWWSIGQFEIYSAAPGTTTTTTTSTAALSTTTATPGTTTTLAPTTTMTPAGANCAASTSGQASLDSSAFTASTNTPSSAADAPQDAITNAVNGTATTRFSSDEDQAIGMSFDVNMGSPQPLDEVAMAVPGSPTDYARGYNVNLSSDGTNWTTVASCTGTGTPEIVSFPAQTDQYVEIVLTATDPSFWWSINQFFVYTASTSTTTTISAPITTTTSGTTTISVPATTTTTGTGGGFPASFWGNTSSIPASSNVMEFAFLNETGIANDPTGSFPDSEVYWDLNGTEFSVAQEPYYSMGDCGACRMYFYLGSPNSKYNDFIEFNTGPSAFNGDTSRVDAFGLPLALHLHNADGTDVVVGEDYGVFDESRSALFTQFENSVASPFQQLATDNAPYTIPSPGDVAAFQPGGADANYMVSYAASVGVTATTQQIFGCSGGTPNLSGDPNECAALNRCVAQDSATQQTDVALYYQTPPCNYYAKFWHEVAANGLAYGFAYDDDNGQSSDISSGDPVYLQIAIGW